MRQVSEGKLDAAMVSSGLQIYGCENVQLLAGLDVALCISWCGASWSRRDCRLPRR